MDIRSVTAAQKYTASKPATEPRPAESSGTLASLGKDFAATLREGEQVAMQSMTGDADPHALVQALAQTELAVETAVTVRNKVVEAYQEILRMPV
ncbi:flagellar hook-basal body complex protein FliE [Shimia sp. W99]